VALVCLALAFVASATRRPSSAAAVATTTLPAGSVVPAGFQPGSVSFVSTTTGFVLGIDSTCPARTCVALARTTNGGSSWVALPAPRAGYGSAGAQAESSLPSVTNVRFANPSDGWVFGPALFATHSGGRTWQQLRLGGSVYALETSGGYVDALVSPCSNESECSGSLRLEQARAAGGAFVTVRSGPSVLLSALGTGAISLHAPVGFAEFGGVIKTALYATSNLANLRGWYAFPDPCAVTRFPDPTLAAFVAPNTNILYSLCVGPGAAGSQQKDLVETQSGVSTVVGSPPSGGMSAWLAATSSGVLVVGAASGASWLYRSVDGGRSWSTVESYRDGGVGFSYLGFTTSTQGAAIHGRPDAPLDQLLMTHDAGAIWRSVSIASRP
jgi:hypothetical protein